MRKIATATFAALFFLGGVSSIGMAQDAFPWRANESSTVRTEPVRELFAPNPPVQVERQVIAGSQNLQSRILKPTQSVVPNRIPKAPSTTAPSIFASLKKSQEENQAAAAPQAQPSLSDVEQYNFDTVPAPGPVNNNAAPAPAYQNVVAPQEVQSPPLTVESNAATELDEPNYCERDCRKNRCELGCIKRVFGTSPSGLEVGGWAQFGYHNRDTILFNNRRGNFAPHQIWMYAGKEASRCGHWDIGYRIDALYGLDAQDTQAFGNSPTGAPDGWDNDWDNGSFGWALPQTYVQLANRDWDVKVGKFFSPIGSESVASPENFFYSRTYTNVLSVPFTLTGILAEKQVSANRSVLVGGTLGWDTGFDQNNGGATLITGTVFRPSDLVDFSIMSSLGDTGVRGDGNMSTVTANMQLTDKVSYSVQGTYLDLDDNQDLGFINSLFREITCCLSVGARIEWWKSDQFAANNRSTYAFTMGANYRRNANLMFRPEVRWDWGGEAVENGQPIVGFDFITLF